MLKKIFLLVVTIVFLTFSGKVYSKELQLSSVDKYLNKISNKFSRTYCNTIQFGISNEGAIEFAIGETNKEFKKHKLNSLVDYKILNNKIINSLENNCQAYDFPIDILDKLVFD